MRRASFQDISVGLEIDQLETFLVEVIPPYAIDQELNKMCKMYRGISRRYRDEECQLNDNVMEEILTILSVFLDSVQSLQSTVVARVHTFIGILRGEQKLYNSAADSFLKALWMYKSHPETHSMQIALTAHRLGVIYGKSGDYHNAIPLLEKALDRYEKEHTKQTLDIITNAKDLLNDYKERHKSRDLEVHEAMKTQRLMKSMPTIPEGRDSSPTIRKGRHSSYN